MKDKIETVARMQASLVIAAEMAGIRVTAFVEEIGGDLATVVANEDTAALLESATRLHALAQEIVAGVKDGTIMTERPTLN